MKVYIWETNEEPYDRTSFVPVYVDESEFEQYYRFLDKRCIKRNLDGQRFAAFFIDMKDFCELISAPLTSAPLSSSSRFTEDIDIPLAKIEAFDMYMIPALKKCQQLLLIIKDEGRAIPYRLIRALTLAESSIDEDAETQRGIAEQIIKEVDRILTCGIRISMSMKSYSSDEEICEEASEYYHAIREYVTDEPKYRSFEEFLKCWEVNHRDVWWNVIVRR